MHHSPMRSSTNPGVSVVLIEDQHDIAANIWYFLERRGHEMDHCADGASGLARALLGDVGVADAHQMCRIDISTCDNNVCKRRDWG